MQRLLSRARLLLRSLVHPSRPPPQQGLSAGTAECPRQLFSMAKSRNPQSEIDEEKNDMAVLPGRFRRWNSLGSCRGSRFATGFAPLEPKPLGSILDLDRASGLASGDLISAWDDYHLGRGHIGTSMKAKLYRLLEHRSATCRHFVIPLWKGNGYTNFFIQVQMPHMIITGLEDYKARGTQASPYLTVTYYTEFAQSKDLVLIRGDVVFTSKLSDSEAQTLIETAQSFYLNDVRYRLVERFNKQTHDFDFKDVLQALDMPLC